MSQFSTTFGEAISETEHQRRHLLLGNGFSIGAYEGFRYATLIAEAYRLNRSVRELFQTLGASDFESAMAHAPDDETKRQIRQSFIDAITSIHPKRDHAILPGQRAACADFLSLFLRQHRSPKRGNVFTTNYDVMLYWVLMEHKARLNCWDGFNPAWTDARIGRTSVYYLHGGLHLHEKPGERQPVRKLQAAGNTSALTLVEAIRDAVRSDHFPLIVSEGTSDEKLARIKQNEYLSAALKQFWAVCRNSDGALFTFGHSLSDFDRHISKLIGMGLIQRIYVSVFGDADKQRIRGLAEEWAALRESRGNPPINVGIFHASEAPVWHFSPRPKCP